ncbi:unnamed protein product [Darwinula stevensoni]|uniref:Guanylate-binding protein N-terminal domain-containing protein n=1 Tax=Darwinula stevensoni TaxID=69355 RepID=A0A7R8XGN3_9CRUS|nr:unnamed protein product [Darwinula stevensoni]CAG0891860.1 unnamed protein product [Darwinula stevensoni]
MDTAGNFDSRETLGCGISVFALSTLLSSVQIYQLENDIGMDNLLNLQIFNGNGQLSLDVRDEKPFQHLLILVTDQSNGNYPYGSEGGKELLDERLQIFNGNGQLSLDVRDEKPFQHLLILVTDQSNGNYPYGSEGGKELLDERLQNAGKRRELREVIEDIKECFSEISGFLMPYPGEKASGDPDLNCFLSDKENYFKEHLQELVSKLFSPEKLVPKRIAGRQITCRELFQYFKCYVRIYNARKDRAGSEIIFEATADVQHQIACDKATEQYKKQMDNLLKGAPVPIHRKLDELHAKYKAKAIDTFSRSKKLGGKELLGRYRDILEKNLNELYQRYKIQRDAREEKSISELQEAKTFALEQHRQNMAALILKIPIVTQEELMEKSQDVKKSVIQTYQKKSVTVNKSVFSNKMKELEKCVGDEYKRFKELRQSKERKAEMELMNAVEEAISKYRNMFPLPGRYLSEEELKDKHLDYYRQAMEYFLETGKRYPHISKRYREKLKKVK